jgi:NAD(P)-dependent dehydrogenase (short-subunit alcohol dehydrogenase family)
MRKTKRQVWFVTGSSRGLGRETVSAALAQGHKVVATAHKPEQVEDLGVAHREYFLALALDVGDVRAVKAAVDGAMARFGRIDVVVNNAGYANVASVEDIAMEDFHAQVNANFFGIVNVTKAVLPILRAQNSGHIINVSTVGSRVPVPGLSAYQAAKCAVIGFSEVLARELAPLRINVTAIEPGGMQTDWRGSSMSIPPISPPYQTTVGVLASRLKAEGSKPLGDPKKVARVLLQLAAMDQPPVRLLLGSEAVAYARAAGKTLADRDAQWEELSRSTDRDDATDAERNPLGKSGSGQSPQCRSPC